MGRSKPRSKAQHPVAAALDRAMERGAERLVLAWADAEGVRYCVSDPGMDVIETAGLLSLTLSDLAERGQELPE